MRVKKARFVPFTKMHGAGNDYIYINTMRYPLDNPEELAIKWSDRHKGIGSDGLVLIDSSSVADFRMRIFNADGSEAMMCGNASRCIGKYVYEYGLTDRQTLQLETLSGVKELKLKVEDKEVVKVTVNMDRPVIGEKMMPLCVGECSMMGMVVSMGNPHLVIFVDDIESVNVSAIGAVLEYHPSFPNRTNVEFVQVLDRENIRMRVWERGSGITLACGTGACASAVAAAVTNKADRHLTVHMDGGPLEIEWSEVSDAVWMTGEAFNVYEGSIEI